MSRSKLWDQIIRYCQFIMFETSPKDPFHLVGRTMGPTAVHKPCGEAAHSLGVLSILTLFILIEK